MTGTELTKQDRNPEKMFVSTDGYTGPVLADITCPEGMVHVTVDPAATVARVQVRSGAQKGPAAEAAKNTRIHQTAERLTIVVPPVPAQQLNNRGGVFVGGNSYSTIQINGVVFNNYSGQGASGVGSTGVEVLVTLPAGSGIKYVSENGSIYTYGILAALKAEATNGSVKAETVGRLEAEAYNGSVKVGTVTEWIDAEASNGSVKVDNYAGSEARIRAGNGSVAMTVAPSATGRIVAKSGNGSIKLYGVRGRSDLDVQASAGNGTVKKF
ncbi:hypothetical protein [Streptomyces sp. NPDC050485]|uniref:hypothetical protein n=1 Tax=Streptomyces sp. NPDC050485 TaxID=3365617 RepID=UPI00379908AA